MGSSRLSDLGSAHIYNQTDCGLFRSRAELDDVQFHRGGSRVLNFFINWKSLDSQKSFSPGLDLSSCWTVSEQLTLDISLF